MPRATVYGDAVEWARTCFLREVARHAPRVLCDLRDGVLPLRRALAFARDEPKASFIHPAGDGRVTLHRDVRLVGMGPWPGSDPASRQHELSQRLRTWQKQHHLIPTDNASRGDWIAERVSRTLDEWSTHAPDRLLTTEEAGKEARKRRDSARTAHTRAYPVWKESWGGGRDEEARRAVRDAARLRLNAKSLSGSPFLHFWFPADEDRPPPISLAEELRLTDWTPEREQALRTTWDAELEAWKRLTEDVGEKKEVAHFRWLALYQCRGMGYSRVGEQERKWSAETERQLGNALADNSVPLADRKATAMRVLLDRGEPWTAYEDRGVWQDLWGASEADAVVLTKTLLFYARKPEAPTKHTVQQAVQQLAAKIGLSLRPRARGGRPKKGITAP